MFRSRKPFLPLTALILTVALSLSACDQASVDDSYALAPTANAVAGITSAPDLITVDNVREGADINGTSADDTDTYIDFTVDQAADIVSCCSRFQVIPVDGGAPLTAIDVTNKTATTTTFTVVFEETFTAADIARGTVDGGILRNPGTGATNPPQAAAVSNGGNTANPDLVSVTQDGDQLLFEFDEPIDRDDDVVQNTSGLRFYTASGDTYNSSVVRTVEGSSMSLRAIYDLPAGVTLDDAAGGFVIAGTVVGDEPDSNDLNELDEASPVIVENPLAVVCPAAPETGEVGDGSGVTEAPDLLAVGNFRRGPFTVDFLPTTCVDFAFDQAAYLNGGTRSNFSLVPLDASDALPGSTNQTPEDDQEGDVVVTVIFPGDLSPADYARGFVDTGVVNSDANTANAANPYNINQAANIGPNTLTENPDLEQDLNSIERGSNVYLTFVFDEPLTDDDVVQNTSGLRVYFPATSQGSTIPSAGAVKVKRINATTLRAKFKDLPEGYRLSDAVGAFVVQGTVQAAVGSRGGNDGKSAFDETFLNIDFPGGS